jgi:hypothetical protein
MVYLYHMNLQEQIHRIKSMMGINEVTNPYSVDWITPTEDYFTQELDELLGNEMRFSKDEFFHPQNYDTLYSLFPHTFKMIAEHSKGDNIESEEEIKEILVGKEISELMDDWNEFRSTLMSDKESQMETFNLFRMGTMERWDDDKINTTYYMGNFSKNFPDMFKDTTSSGLLKQMGDDVNLQGYSKNIENFRNDRNLQLPPPFVMSLPNGGREGNMYTLIGGHKRSTVARQLNVPVDVWFIDLSKNKNMNESDNKENHSFLSYIKKFGLYYFMETTQMSLTNILLKIGELPRDIIERYIIDFIMDEGEVHHYGEEGELCVDINLYLTGLKVIDKVISDGNLLEIEVTEYERGHYGYNEEVANYINESKEFDGGVIYEIFNTIRKKK